MALDQQHEKVNQLRSDILQTQDAMGQVAAKSAEDYKEQVDTSNFKLSMDKSI
jgi:hypothetical protein